MLWMGLRKPKETPRTWRGALLPINVTFGVSCSKGTRPSRSTSGNLTISAPGSSRLPIAGKKQGLCAVTVTAAYSDVNAATAGGTIDVKITGKRHKRH